MGAALQGNFIEGGEIDPFTGLAPATTPEQEQARLDARREQLRQAATRTANINNAPGGYLDGRVAGRQEDSSQTAAQLAARLRSGDPYVTLDMVKAAQRSESLNHKAMNSAGYKALTYGILAGPSLVTGGAAAAGGPQALGFGVGEGSLVGGSEGTGLALADTSTAGAEAAMNAAHVPVAAAAGEAAGPSLGGMIGADLSAAAGPAALIAAPYAINALTSGKTKEEKALLAKQEQMAAEAKVRQGQQQDARMNALGQQMLAFNPRNQMMASMFGPQAAFTPEAMAQMAQGPAPSNNPALTNYAGTDQAMLKAKAEQMRRQAEYDKAEAARREMIMNGVQQPGPGPAPIQMPTPQPARRY